MFSISSMGIFDICKSFSHAVELGISIKVLAHRDFFPLVYNGVIGSDDYSTYSDIIKMENANFAVLIS